MTGRGGRGDVADWRPIDTAPRDRTMVLVCATKILSRETRRTAPIMAVDFWHSHDRDGYEGWGHFNPTFYPATHWMPLPDAPTTPPRDGAEAGE